MSKTAVITGGSSGIGLATARLFAEKGYIVYELSRSGKSTENIIHITADITDEVSISTAFEKIFAETGHIDVLVNNAGFGIGGPIESTSLELAKKQFDVNFFGCFSCCHLVLPYMRKNGGGHIVNLSSVAAPLAVPFQAFYSASKAAINAMTLALANEVRSFGIKVSAVMPGDVRTGFTDAREKVAADKETYGETPEHSIASMEKDERNGMQPITVAKVIYKAASKSRPKPLYIAGFKYKLFYFIYKILPAGLVNYLEGLLYK